MNEMIHKMEQHVSVRKYKEESIPKDVVERMVQAAQHAASSHFVQAYSVIYVTDQDLKGETSRVIRKSSCERLRSILCLLCRFKTT